jgi:hypothetical protein
MRKLSKGIWNGNMMTQIEIGNHISMHLSIYLQTIRGKPQENYQKDKDFTGRFWFMSST